jgi:hypothetical protein
MKTSDEGKYPVVELSTSEHFRVRGSLPLPIKASRRIFSLRLSALASNYFSRKGAKAQR